MSKKVTVIAPIVLASGKTEADLLEASRKFQKEFVDNEPSILRRELVKKGENEYLDIILFRSEQDAKDIQKKEMESTVCHEFFSVMDMSQELEIRYLPSLEIYQKLS